MVPSKNISRRSFAAGVGASYAVLALGQGVSTRKTDVAPRGKPSNLPFTATFVDVGLKAGLVHPTTYGGREQKQYIIEAIGCGCAFIDYDNDGWMDVFVLSGSSFGARQSQQSSSRLYKNNRDGTFTDVTHQAGLENVAWCCGVTVGDYNNDGYDDLFVTRWGTNSLYRNNGNGTFTDVTVVAGLKDISTRWSTGCTFVETTRNGRLDLFVANYIEFDPEKAPKPGAKANCLYGGIPVNCGPRGFPAGKNSLYRNNGDGTFTDVSVVSGIRANSRGSFGLTAVAADFDNDGWPDIYVACDSTPGLLYRNKRDGTFAEEGVIRGTAYSDDGQEQAGMGLAVGDYDLDGWLDIFKTNFSADVPNLYRNDKTGSFEDVGRRAGVATDNRFVCWGAGMVDFENKGFPDLFMVGGHVYPEIEKFLPSEPSTAPRILFRATSPGHFEELTNQAGPALNARHSSRGCAFGDFDNDGDVDVLIVNLGEPPTLLRNDLANKNNWLKFKLVGVRSNRSGIGTRVTVTTASGTQTQELQAQSSFLSCNDPRLHFGLGDASSASVHVRWPSGEGQDVPVTKLNQLITVHENVAEGSHAGHR